MKYFWIGLLVLFFGFVLFSGKSPPTLQKRADAYYQTCANLSQDSQEVCLITLIRKISKTESLDVVYELFSRFATSGDVECHSLAHAVGRIAQQQTNTDLSAAVLPGRAQLLTYCGWGFWHGYMSQMTEMANITSTQLRDFCQKQGKLYDAESDCFHGIGLGAIGDPPPRELWGDSQKLFAKSSALCDETAPDTHRETCYQGGFHQIIDYMAKDSFSFTRPDPENPFSLCFDQDARYQHACFIQMAPGVYERSGGKAFQLPAMHIKLRTLSYYPEIVTALVSGAVNATGTANHLSEMYEQCAQNTGLNTACIDGIVIGSLGKGDAKTVKDDLAGWCASLPPSESTYCTRKLSTF
ncbi:MAG: hypothetical protein CV087_07945 [Candidatus Brocadia sp. WS118]|nr:MAG: hypothetical protein CV087_07945 [Candidatus Brocadia sp. WS118]